MRKKILLWATLFLCTTDVFITQAVVIIIHGSFASTTTWPQPQGDFFREIQNQAHQLGQKVISFCWSGIPTDQEIIKGGTMLAQLIMSYPGYEEIVLIGHSHGGNVINIASQLLYKLNQEEQSEVQTEINQIVLAIPTLITTPSFQLLATTRIDSQTQTVLSEESSFQNLMSQASLELRLWSLKFLTKTQANHSIEFSYLLGTPVNMAKFWPSMEIIKNMILFYSDNDLVQPVLGMFEKTYPTHERRANVKVKLYTSGRNEKAPSHSDLHSTMVGRWLLCIPKVLTQLKIGNFSRFTFGINGSIDFYETKNPNYHM